MRAHQKKPVEYPGFLPAFSKFEPFHAAIDSQLGSVSRAKHACRHDCRNIYIADTMIRQQQSGLVGREMPCTVSIVRMTNARGNDHAGNQMDAEVESCIVNELDSAHNAQTPVIDRMNGPNQPDSHQLADSDMRNFTTIPSQPHPGRTDVLQQPLTPAPHTGRRHMQPVIAAPIAPFPGR